MTPTNALSIRRPQRSTSQPPRPGQNTDSGDSLAAPTSSNTLFVLPREREDGFRASIRGYILDLADPSSGHALAPTPDDLFITSISSDLAWSARMLLRAHGLPDDVSVSATWRTHEDRPSMADIKVTITVAEGAEPVSEALAAALESRLAARSLSDTVVHISLEGVSA